METSLIDTANLLAEIISPETTNDTIHTERLTAAINATTQRKINATVWNKATTSTNLRVYVTNHLGKVIYDSANLALGKDYSRWNDVYLTLRGKYGARSTQEDIHNSLSTVMYIGAPIYSLNSDPDNPFIYGVLSVGKPNISLDPFLQAARNNIHSKGLLLLLLAAIAGAILATLLSLNIQKLVNYAKKISQGEQIAPLHINDPDLSKLAKAMENMRQALDGKEYIEQYILSLTHEMKSPLTALQGAAELISDTTNDSAMRKRLANNIGQQTDRLRALIDHLLALARLENLAQLENIEQFNLAKLIKSEANSLDIQLKQKSIQLKFELDSNIQIKGDSLLLGQAIRNLLENAIEFSPAASCIQLQLTASNNKANIFIQDYGTGIPDYALEQVWNRFYSLPRPDSGQKSTGLGLSFVKQIALLHQAEVRLKNNPEGGVTACISLSL